MSSSIFLKSNVSSVIDTTEFNTEFPSWLTVSVTEQKGGNANSDTSDVFMSQINNSEVNNLVNMITSIDNQKGGALQETATDELENQLRQILNGNHGAKEEVQEKAQNLQEDVHAEVQKNFQIWFKKKTLTQRFKKSFQIWFKKKTLTQRFKKILNQDPKKEDAHADVQEKPLTKKVVLKKTFPRVQKSF